MASGVGELLLDLPSSMYLANHETAPSADQVIRTDPTSILIRQLQTRKAQLEKKLRGTPGPKAADKGKRVLEPGSESQRAGKRHQTGEAGPSHAGPSGSAAAPAGDAGSPAASAGSPSGSGAGVPPPLATKFSRLALQARTIRELQTILKAWALPVSGKKDDLITRILDEQQRAAVTQGS